MEETIKSIESLLEQTYEFGKVTYKITKLKTVAKASDIISFIIPNSIIVLFLLVFLLFLNLGVALWLGEFFKNPYSGFLVVAAFYGLIGIFMRLVMYKWLKKRVRNYVVKQILK